MAELLLHSLSEFDVVIFASIARLKPRGILEIGSETGAFSARLLAYCEKNGVPLTVIEPHRSPRPSSKRRCGPASPSRPPSS